MSFEMLQKLGVRTEIGAIERECRELRHRLDRLPLERAWLERLILHRDYLLKLIEEAEADS